MPNIQTVSRSACQALVFANASAVPKMLVNGQSENALFVGGAFFETSLKSMPGRL